MSDDIAIGYSVAKDVRIVRVKHRVGIVIGRTSAEQMVRYLSQVPQSATIDDIDVSEDGTLARIEFHEEKLLGDA